MSKKHLLFFLYFGIVPLFCVLIDLIFSTINPPPDGSNTYYFDFSLINQIVYFSVWVSITTSVVGIYLVIWYCKGEYDKIANFDVMMTSIISFNTVIFLTYWLSMFISPNTIQGFNTPYKIFKATTEHAITPLLFVFYYFFVWKNNARFGTKDYIKYKSWYLLIIPGIYIIFYLTRVFLIHNYAREHDFVYDKYPYAESSLWKKPAYIWLSITIIYWILPATFGIGYNYLSNLNKITLLQD